MTEWSKGMEQQWNMYLSIYDLEVSLRFEMTSWLHANKHPL